MIQLLINNHKVSVQEGTTVLDAAKTVGIDIPTMCHLKEGEPYTSCLICVVKDVTTGQLIPSCSTRVQTSMNIQTDCDEVLQARKAALDLLLSDHVGDCEAPCRMGCPAYMDIPKMLSLIEAGNMQEALVTVKNHISIPATLGRICPAPCEKVCRRGKVDQAIPICELKRMVADIDLERTPPFIPECQPSNGKKVGIIGAGPAGLSAAYYLQILGYQCVLYDDHEKPGGMLQYGNLDVDFDRSILDSEIDILRKMGCRFDMGVRVGEDVAVDQIRSSCDALIITTGSVDENLFQSMQLEFTEKGLLVDRRTLVTNQKNIFAGGGAIGSSKLAVRSVGHGRRMAYAVHASLSGEPYRFDQDRFQSRAGKLGEGDLAVYVGYAEGLRGRDEGHGYQMEGTEKSDAERLEGRSHTECGNEGVRVAASNCLHCECLGADACKLRDYSGEYHAGGSAYFGAYRMPVEKDVSHPSFVYEPNKCIRCGICVRIAKANQEALGLTFIGRGFHVKVGSPFNAGLDKALEKVALECVEKCPTGALEERKNEYPISK